MNTGKPEIKNELYTMFLKTLASTFIGPSLTDAVFDLRDKLKQKRVNEFVESIATYFGSEKLRNIDERRLATEAFSDIMENVLVKVSKTRSIAKIALFKQVLIDHIVSDTTADMTEMYLEIIDKITEKQLLILKGLSQTPTARFADLYEKMHHLQTEINTMMAETRRKVDYIKDDSQMIGRMLRTWEYNAYDPATYNCEPSEFKYLIQDLFNKGLIKDKGATFGAEPFVLVEINEMGIAILDFLKHDTAKPIKRI